MVGSASTSSARSSGTAAHSSSKKISSVPTAVARSSTFCSRAPRSGSLVSVAKFRYAKAPAFSTRSWMSWRWSTAVARAGAPSSPTSPWYRFEKSLAASRAAARSASRAGSPGPVYSRPRSHRTASAPVVVVMTGRYPPCPCPTFVDLAAAGHELDRLLLHAELDGRLGRHAVGLGVLADVLADTHR